LESVKAHIVNIVSLESIVAGSDGQKLINSLAVQQRGQIEENERQLERICGFKSSLYENMINGILTKEEYKVLKSKYNSDKEILRKGIHLSR
jgi:hypothetical protein